MSMIMATELEGPQKSVQGAGKIILQETINYIIGIYQWTDNWNTPFCGLFKD